MVFNRRKKSKIMKQKEAIKAKLHPRNKHRAQYDFKALIATCPKLADFVAVNQYGNESIDFFNPEAVRTLNKALLHHFYGIENWEFPANYLCPPIPGRADYLHHIADVLATANNGKVPKGEKVKCLDIGVGANCIYPIIGKKEYAWSFVGSDIDPISFASAQNIIERNPFLQDKIELRFQENVNHFFKGIIKANERIDLSICNPPYHSSYEESQSEAIRKLRNLKGKKINKPILNFGGQNNELWCEGGEVRFVQDMIKESIEYSKNCLWFSTIISKEANLPEIFTALKEAKVAESNAVEIGQGNKVSRIVVWTFMNKKQQRIWAEARWG
jgi:23S rRNA (adenine1618-N6)-methyltransferase